MFRAEDPGFMLSGFRVEVGFRVWGLGFWVWG